MNVKIEIPKTWWKVESKLRRVIFVSTTKDKKIIFYRKNVYSGNFEIALNDKERLAKLFKYVSDEPIKTNELPEHLKLQIGKIYEETHNRNKFWIKLKEVN